MMMIMDRGLILLGRFPFLNPIGVQQLILFSEVSNLSVRTIDN